ncbi:MAG TPA: SGNH/GDSL hydrolase family protein [Gemmatimonadales bacterium]
MTVNRREFIGQSAALTAALAAPGALFQRAGGATILFQGDSITDCGRNRKSTKANDTSALGPGYPLALAGMLRDRYPSRDFQVYNRGVSGNTVQDLKARWTPDTIALAPAVLSILIGVNDKWHTLDGSYKGTADSYHAGYAALLAATRTALPGVHIIVLEPFALHTGAVTEAWFPDFDRYRAAARQVADQARATFVPLHDMFQQLARKSSPAYWASDGVHPTVAGHEAIAQQWLSKVKVG